MAIAIWLALLIAPLVVLGQQSLSFALTTPSCSHQIVWTLHTVALVAVACTLVATLLAAWRWRSLPADASAEGARRRFMAGVAAGVGLLSMVVALAMWVPVWVLSPCAA